MRSLLYVSRIRLSSGERQAGIDDIVARSLVRNQGLGVTGALIATQSRFAQVLEGSDAALEILMSSIRRDPRHEDLKVILDHDIAQRRFARWSMTYCGQAGYVERLVEPLGAAERPVLEADWLRLCRFMEKMV